MLVACLLVSFFSFTLQFSYNFLSFFPSPFCIQNKAFNFLENVVASLAKINMYHQPEGEGGDGVIEYNWELLDTRLKLLEDRFQLFQKSILDDTQFQAEVTDLTSWLSQMENKIAGNLDVQEEEQDMGEEEEVTGKAEEAETETEGTEKKNKKEKKKEKKQSEREEAVIERLEQEAELKHDLDSILDASDTSYMSSPMTGSLGPELYATNERLKKLAYNLNDQLHSLRDKVFLVDHELKRMAKGVEFALMRAKVSGADDMVSSHSYSTLLFSYKLLSLSDFFYYLQVLLFPFHSVLTMFFIFLIFVYFS